MIQHRENLIKRMLAQNQIMFCDGEFDIWGMPMMVFPMNSIILLDVFMNDRIKEDYQNILYFLGKEQARTGGNIMYEKFGYKRNRKSAEAGNEQGEIVGMGHQEYVKFDLENKHFLVRIQNPPFGRQYLKLFGKQSEPVCHFLRGLVTGANEAVAQCDLVGIERQCVAQGRLQCVFEVKPAKEWDLTDSTVKCQFPDESVNNQLSKEKTRMMAWQKPQKFT